VLNFVASIFARGDIKDRDNKWGVIGTQNCTRPVPF
jgi:hypothetical protein